jgi:transposase
MHNALRLRGNYDAKQLRALSKSCSDAKQVRRMLAIAAIYDGKSRQEAAEIGGMDRQILRDWVIRFNEAGPDGLINKKPCGPKRRLNDEQMLELEAIVEAGPEGYVDGLVRWRCCDLRDIIEQRFGVVYKKRAVGNLLKVLDFSHISGRPQNPKQDPQVLETFKKTSPGP